MRMSPVACGREQGCNILCRDKRTVEGQAGGRWNGGSACRASRRMGKAKRGRSRGWAVSLLRHCVVRERGLFATGGRWTREDRGILHGEQWEGGGVGLRAQDRGPWLERGKALASCAAAHVAPTAASAVHTVVPVCVQINKCTAAHVVPTPPTPTPTHAHLQLCPRAGGGVEAEEVVHGALAHGQTRPAWGAGAGEQRATTRQSMRAGRTLFAGLQVPVC